MAIFPTRQQLHEQQPSEDARKRQCQRQRPSKKRSSHLTCYILGALSMFCVNRLEPRIHDKIVQLRHLYTEGDNLSNIGTLQILRTKSPVEVSDKQQQGREEKVTSTSPTPTSLDPDASSPDVRLQLQDYAKQIRTIKADHDEACRNYPESIDAFIRDVANHTETQGLSKWQHRNNSKWMLPPLTRDLLDSAFHEKRIALVGDSTMYYLMQWLHVLLKELPEEFVQSLHMQNQTTAFRSVEQYLKKTQGGMHYTDDFIFQRYNRSTSTKSSHILWKGFNGGNMKQNCRFDELVWPQVLEHRPDIIVANWGLHMLWRPKVQECNVPQNLYYETFFLERVLDVALEAGTKLVLFKTTNLMCNNNRFGIPPMQEQQYHYQQQQRQGICRSVLLEDDRHHGSLTQHYNLTNDELLRYCDESAFEESSSKKLNLRLEQFVVVAKRNPKYSRLTIEILNDHDLESCGYTQWNDGVHFQLLAFSRLRLLAHMIHCLWKDAIR